MEAKAKLHDASHSHEGDATLAVVNLIKCFPFPIAMLDQAGVTMVINEPFRLRFDSEILNSGQIKDAIPPAGSGWRTVNIGRSSDEQVACRILSVDSPSGSLLILEDTPGAELLRKLDQLQDQVSSLKRLSSSDVLTGAWNRNHFERVAAMELERSLRHRQPVSLLLLDIDYFKQINDTHGHQAGDMVLRELVAVVKSAMRSIDMLFRWGGEEFVVLAASTGYRGAAVLAEKLRKTIAAHPFPHVGALTVSIGVAENLAPESLATWFERLDHALYLAKNSGRNRIAVEKCGSSDSWAAESGQSAVRLVWQEAYECGEPAIDQQHQELFALANASFEASFKAAATPEHFEAAIDKLLAHIVAHFAYEESALSACHYEGLEQHKAAHAALLARTGELRATIAIGQSTIGELVDFIADKVVAQHLFTADRKFFSLFQDQHS